MGKQSTSPLRHSDQSFALKCMDGSGCSEHFAEGTIRKFLDSKTFESFDKLRTAHEIEQVQGKYLFIDLGGIGGACLLSILLVCCDNG